MVEVEKIRFGAYGLVGQGNICLPLETRRR